jgi:nickel/cobalt exporter
MPSFAELIQQSSAHAWLFIPSAILLGALHGLEPGHSKTMMAAFIVAIRGTVTQAVLLGLAATASHTLVVWAIALCGMYLWQGIDAEIFEPYFQLLSAAVIIGIAFWMIWRTRSDQMRARAAAGDHHQGHRHGHDHGHDHKHDHTHEELPATGGYQDAHEAAHANDIRRQFSERNVTTWQIVLFGLTGGLIPCPAAITVLLLCLQLKEFNLGFVLVLCFSIGLAIILVLVGVVAALSLRHASKRWSWFGSFARRAPYFSSILILAVGLYIGYQGWTGLSAGLSAIVELRVPVAAASARRPVQHIPQRRRIGGEMRIETGIGSFRPAFGRPEQPDLVALAFPHQHRSPFIALLEGAVIFREVIADALIEFEIAPAALAREGQLARHRRAADDRHRHALLDVDRRYVE